LFLTNCLFSCLHLVLYKVNITRPSTAIEESNRFRKRFKGLEFTIVRTKGDVLRRADDDDVRNSSEDLEPSEQGGDGDDLEQSDGDDPEPRRQGGGSDGDDLMEPSEQGDGNDLEPTTSEQGDGDNPEPREHGDTGDLQLQEPELQEPEEPAGKSEQGDGDNPEPREHDNTGNLQLQEPELQEPEEPAGDLQLQEQGDGGVPEPREHGDTGDLQLQEPELQEPAGNLQLQEQGDGVPEPREHVDSDDVELQEPGRESTTTHVQEAPAAGLLSFLCHSTKLDHFLTIDDIVKETNPFYCQSGYYLCGRHCARCAIGFVASLSNSNEFEREVRPSAKTPGWVCVHGQKNASMSGGSDQNGTGTCNFVLCHDCFQMAVSSSSSAKKSTRTRRRKHTGRQD
jgi:hypothetical protein